ncbi:MAG TPA: CpsD/CapB family tyrosine-protein kinase [Candidatus Eisenbacteria bacterium]|nr:CpsD/CapB family tyrosine-protein kinase [Candidatus Eisenbacteria bacterium]
MTRIFDALRKVQGRPAPEAARPVPTPVPPLPPQRVSPARALEPDRTARLRQSVVRVHAMAPLPEDVLREMTTLRVSLEAALLDHVPRVIMFVSSQGGEGTTAIASQFAFTVAQDRRLRVLIVDAHARRPAFDRAHGPDGSLAHPIAAGAAGGGESVDVLPLAAEHRDSAMIAPGVARDVVAALGPAYDWVLFDGPPVLESPDAATLAAIADGTVIVVHAGRTKRPVLARTVDLLRKTGARPLGTVLNRRRLEIPEFIYRRI